VEIIKTKIMDIATATANIGKEFKWRLVDRWDVIRQVTPDGTIIGDSMEAPAFDCRLKEPVPEGFKKVRHVDYSSIPGFPDVDARGMCYSDADPGL
jgi:hypothetical protein